jgi:hypothetical protein
MDRFFGEVRREKESRGRLHAKMATKESRKPRFILKIDSPK